VRFVQVISGKKCTPCVDFTCLNAAAILYTAGKCDSLKKGVDMSRGAIEDGRALEKLRHWIMCQDATGSRGLHTFESLLKRAGV
jgi:anthranilate phosphoribosyltransferase